MHQQNGIRTNLTCFTPSDNMIGPKKYVCKKIYGLHAQKKAVGTEAVTGGVLQKRCS